MEGCGQPDHLTASAQGPTGTKSGFTEFVFRFEQMKKMTECSQKMLFTVKRARKL